MTHHYILKKTTDNNIYYHNGVTELLTLDDGYTAEVSGKSMFEGDAFKFTRKDDAHDWASYFNSVPAGKGKWSVLEVS